MVMSKTLTTEHIVERRRLRAYKTFLNKNYKDDPVTYNQKLTDYYNSLNTSLLRPSDQPPQQSGDIICYYVIVNNKAMWGPFETKVMAQSFKVAYEAASKDQSKQQEKINTVLGRYTMKTPIRVVWNLDNHPNIESPTIDWPQYKEEL